VSKAAFAFNPRAIAERQQGAIRLQSGLATLWAKFNAVLTSASVRRTRRMIRHGNVAAFDADKP
jgi:hypothetical protein